MIKSESLVVTLGFAGPESQQARIIKPLGGFTIG